MILEISQEYLENEMKKVNAHPASFKIFKDKSRIIPLKLFDIPAPGANIIKQEMLSSGGDAAVHKNAVDCSVETSDVILLGTKKHYNILMEKLQKMPYFKLNNVCGELKEFFSAKKTNSIKSPWGRTLSFDKTRVMGIINVTSDSFYPGSRKQSIQEILDTAQDMIQSGADVVDIGGMSTRPGSDPISEEEETKRVVMAIKAIRENYHDVMISVDTYRSNVAEKALEAGADIINDVSGFSFDQRLIEVAAKSNAPYILMHIKGTPKNMQENPAYDDLIKEIAQYFVEKINYAISFNMNENNIILDPGLGFGKTYEDNMEIMDRVCELQSLHRPLLIAASRKSFIGKALGLKSPENRLEGTLAITALCAYHDVDMVRVHDVRENVRIIEMVEAIKCRR
ncbi:dihydropteroate synthase [Tepidanaerobacter syntrophicus]|uniref:Dihydropteroate synthase n=1 Tax=Tepidanaerobacter syntrophicus TaxID=224999 RepID=A0A0U9HFQ6_9FIRM|nr:dihydropteroate synthase [Tepidanaerobacter syntrophicus]GAQ25621.1 dihydropteroate synthase [Tepidanaerobacter syntrophicus]